MNENRYPTSLAIAGAWGYIGLKFLQAARRRAIPTFVFDPGTPPPDAGVADATRVADEADFYRLPVELFHLAMHPEHRRRALETLLARSSEPSFAILNEKPMAAPESPEQCGQLIEELRRTGVLMLFDFPELFDPLTERILDHLQQFRELQIHEIYVQRSKDREDPSVARNTKRMVPIQYQESVHCLAFVLYVLGRLHGRLDAAFEGGLACVGESQPYQPPNPQAYAYTVDGRCRYRLTIGAVQVSGLTDFKAGAAGMKRRILRGSGDGRPWCIEVDYQEGRKRLLIDGVDLAVDSSADSYEAVLRTFTAWRRGVPGDELSHGVYPNPPFAQAAYQLSSVLWRCCRDSRPIRLASLTDLLAFDARFIQAIGSCQEMAFP